MKEAKKQMSLSLWTVIAEGLEIPPAATAKLLPEQCILQCTGRLSAQVALLQSPILSAAKTSYLKNQIYRGPPVDKPHTSVLTLAHLTNEMRPTCGWVLMRSLQSLA